MKFSKMILVLLALIGGVALFQYSTKDSISNKIETSQDEAYVEPPFESHIQSLNETSVEEREETAKINQPTWFKKLSPEEQQELMAQIDQEQQIQAEIRTYQETEVLDDSVFGIVSDDNTQGDL